MPCDSETTYIWKCDDCGEIIMKTNQTRNRPKIFYPFWGTSKCHFDDDVCFCNESCRNDFAVKNHATYLGETWKNDRV